MTCSIPALQVATVFILPRSTPMVTSDCRNLCRESRYDNGFTPRKSRRFHRLHQVWFAHRQSPSPPTPVISITTRLWRGVRIRGRSCYVNWRARAGRSRRCSQNQQPLGTCNQEWEFTDRFPRGGKRSRSWTNPTATVFANSVCRRIRRHPECAFSTS